ncbi:MAG: hypothetical protein JXA60_01615 [Candidatus Coatesbacteria bacterium]|nr:hypothetical protein [Candidatus Coatesbacteria bacterium]
MQFVELKCPNCGYSGKDFKPAGNDLFVCPACGSLLILEKEGAALRSSDKYNRNLYLSRFMEILKAVKQEKEIASQHHEKDYSLNSSDALDTIRDMCLRFGNINPPSDTVIPVRKGHGAIYFTLFAAGLVSLIIFLIYLSAIGMITCK